MPRPASPFTPFGTTPMGVHEGAEVIEPISRRQTGCHYFPQSVLDLCRKMVRRPHQIGEEAGTLLLQRTTQIPRDRTHLGIRICGRRGRLTTHNIHQPLTVFAREKTDGSEAGRNNAPPIHLP